MPLVVGVLLKKLLVFVGVNVLLLTRYIFLQKSKDYNNLKLENNRLKEENRILRNEVQLREGEITYWGMKYDSILVTINNH